MIDKHIHLRPIMGWGDALWVSEIYRSIPWNGYSTMMKPVYPAKVQYTIHNPGIPPRTSWDVSILHTDSVILTFWKLSNAPEGGHTIGHHFPWWRWRVIVSSKGKHSKYIYSNHFFNISISFVFWDCLANAYGTLRFPRNIRVAQWGIVAYNSTPIMMGCHGSM